VTQAANDTEQLMPMMVAIEQQAAKTGQDFGG